MADENLSKCRCCFRILMDDSQMILIDNQIANKFFELTQIELILNNVYPSSICELCDRDLRNFFHWKKDLSLKQLQLYELNPCLEEDADEDSVKIEALDDAIILERDDENLLNYGSETFEEFKPDAANGDGQVLFSIVKERKTLRKQTIESLAKQTLQQTHKKDLIECNECGLLLANGISLKRHNERVHQKIRNFHCDQCPYSAFFKHTLEKHVVKHIPDEFRARFVCDCCDFVSISAVNIVLHKKYEHSQSRQLSVCEHKNCGKEFSRPGQLTAHIRLTHEKRKDKMCSSCSRSFSTTTRLKEHVMSTHSNDNVRDFACEFCAKQFMTLRQLKNHQVYHDEPKFECQMGCNKKFYKAVLLVGHHKTHLEQKDFSCPVCGVKYFLKSHLNRHIQAAHDKIKINCELCESSFVRKETYRNHVLNHHKQDMEEVEVEALLKKIREMKPAKNF